MPKRPTPHQRIVQPARIAELYVRRLSPNDPRLRRASVLLSEQSPGRLLGMTEGHLIHTGRYNSIIAPILPLDEKVERVHLIALRLGRNQAAPQAICFSWRVRPTATGTLGFDGEFIISDLQGGRSVEMSVGERLYFKNLRNGDRVNDYADSGATEKQAGSPIGGDSSFWDDLTDFFSGLGEWIKDAFSDIWEWIKDLGEEIWRQIKDGSLTAKGVDTNGDGKVDGIVLLKAVPF